MATAPPLPTASAPSAQQLPIASDASSPRLKFITLTPALYQYVRDHSTPRDAVLLELAAETAALGRAANMQIAAEQGALLTMLVQLMGARSLIEIGTFTGYSALCLARGLGPEGRLLCCDVSEEWTRIARRAWARAGVAERIELKLAPALETLAALPPGTRFDLAFIDADKANYRAYYEALLPHLRDGGLVLFDNTLWSGAVIDESVNDEDTAALRALNAALRDDPRVEVVLLPIADGLTLARKRAVSAR